MTQKKHLSFFRWIRFQYIVSSVGACVCFQIDCFGNSSSDPLYFQGTILPPVISYSLCRWVRVSFYVNNPTSGTGFNIKYQINPLSKPFCCLKFRIFLLRSGQDAFIHIHSFILAVSTAPDQVHYYSEALQTSARIMYRSFTPKFTGNCK